VVVITFRRMLKATVANGTNELWLQEELLEAGRMDTGVNVGIPEVQDKAPTQEAVSERQTDQHQRARVRAREEEVPRAYFLASSSFWSATGSSSS